MTYIQAALTRLNRTCPGLDPELAQLYALLALTRGTRTTLRDVHDAWAIWRTTTRPDHPSIVPFDQLTPQVQELDRKYMTAIHQTAKAVTR
jgi:hypothetical protein